MSIDRPRKLNRWDQPISFNAPLKYSSSIFGGSNALCDNSAAVGLLLGSCCNSQVITAQRRLASSYHANEPLTIFLASTLLIPIWRKSRFRPSKILDDSDSLSSGRKLVVHLEEHDLIQQSNRIYDKLAKPRLTPRLYISALSWVLVRKPRFRDWTSGAMYNLVPTSAFRQNKE